MKKKTNKHHKTPRANAQKSAGTASESGALSDETLDQVSGGTTLTTTSATSISGPSALQQAINNIKNKAYA